MPSFTPPSFVEQEIQQLQAFVQELFPDPTQLARVVPPKLQQAELNTLQAGRRAEQFYFTVDLPTLTLSNATGLEEIGYDSSRFTFRKYLSCIPSQGMLQLVTLLGKQSFLMSDKSVLTFMNPKFVASIPITIADGRIMLVKRTISPWQFTEQGQLVGYLSEFTVLKPYDNEPMAPRFVNMPPELEAEFNTMVARVFANLPAKTNPFSPKEIGLLKLYVETNERALSIQELATLAGISVHTVHTHNRNILAKAKTMFGSGLSAKTAREVAFFLKKSGMLG